MAKILIAYFSRKGQNYVNGKIKNLAKGHTERVAEFIQQAVGGDLFEIQTVRDYPADYTQCTEAAKEELRSKARPELKAYPDSLGGYDTGFLGYPNWWGTMPMACYTFLEKYDMSGKTILPFCTHEGSGMGAASGKSRNSARRLTWRKACPSMVPRPQNPPQQSKPGRRQGSGILWAILPE